jgi:hypothetical protein
MKRVVAAMGVGLVAGAVLLGAGSPAIAKKKAPAVSCKSIKEALASGKTADEVAADLKTSAKHVAACQAPAKKHHGHRRSHHKHS